MRSSFRRGGALGAATEGTAWRVPPERWGRTLRRITPFFRHQGAQVGVVLVAIIATSRLGLINPLLLKALIGVAGRQQDREMLNLFVGLMIVRPTRGTTCMTMQGCV